MSLQAWHYFISLERDFIETINYVELSPRNAAAYSFEFAKLLLLIGSETDVVAKMLCKKIAPTTKAENIKDYRDIITNAFTGMHAVEIDIPRLTSQDIT